MPTATGGTATQGVHGFEVFFWFQKFNPMSQMSTNKQSNSQTNSHHTIYEHYLTLHDIQLVHRITFLAQMIHFQFSC